MADGYKIITEIDPHSIVSEQYCKLRTSIDFSSFNKDLKVINLTSTVPKEGKTITALNVAMVYAQSKQKTLIIDLDLRKPKIHRSFSISNQGGVSDYIINEHSIKNNIHKVNEHLDVLVSGSKVPFPAEVLVSNKIKEMMKELVCIYDKIIIDCPPLTAVADATIISNFSDATLFVVGSRKTDRDLAKTMVRQLKDSGANIIGGVMTQVSKKDAFYGMDYYYYGEN